jgi:hypothetical protein
LTGRAIPDAKTGIFTMTPIDGTHSSGGGTITWTYKVALKVDFLDASKNETTTLKVGKWENSFNAGPTVKDEFIAPDNDKLYVRVNDQSKKGTGKVSVKLSTDSAGTDYDDDATEIELPEEPANSGIFISTNMLMVSDDVDDDFTNPSVVVDDTKNDRTHKIALGGKVKVQYPETGTVICEKEANVPPSLKTVDVVLVILRDKAQSLGGTPVISVAAVSNDWRLVRERYAQVGVTVNWSGPTVHDPPAGVDLSDGLDAWDGTHSVVQELKDLVAGLGSTNTTSDIHVFYVNDAKAGIVGLAVAQYWFTNAADQGYLYNIVLDTSEGVFDPAHELGHLLMNSGYGTGIDQFNLMYEATYGANTVTTMKRINANQETLIQGNSHVY